LCNAGILDAPLGLSEDGYEIHFGVNYLGHALLIKLLFPLLLKTIEIQGDVRVILLTSSGYRFHDPRGIIFKDLRTTQQNLTRLGMFGGMLRYFQSKLAIILYTDELARRYPMIKVVAVHPGIVDTPLTPHVTNLFLCPMSQAPYLINWVDEISSRLAPASLSTNEHVANMW
jgi:retinol dehydrogenase-12